MNIVETYSHLNGLEYLLVHKPQLWNEIETVIATVDLATLPRKVSKEQTKRGQLLYSPIAMNKAVRQGLHNKGWQEQRTSYWVTKNTDLIHKTLNMPEEQQKQTIMAAGEKPVYSYNQTDFVKDRVAIEVQFGKYAFVAFDLFVKHMAFFVGNVIDLGIEILPMKSLQKNMSTGIGYYESELYNLIRQGRGIPAVPLVVVGIA